MKESSIQNAIRNALAPYAVMLRVNSGKWQTIDGRWVEGAPKGTADLIGFRLTDGRFVAIEVKAENGKLRPEQASFLQAVRNAGGVAGLPRRPVIPLPPRRPPMTGRLPVMLPVPLTRRWRKENT